jgi:predicted small secreted protein
MTSGDRQYITERIMKKIIIACVGALLLLSACNTVQGLGQDLSNTGDDISNLAKKVEGGISNR